MALLDSRTKKIFEFLGACLAMPHSDSSRFDTERAMPDTIAQWENIIETANFHLLLPAFYRCLKEKGLYDHLPRTVREKLLIAYKINSERNKRIKNQTIAIIKLFNAIGVEPLLIKGASHLLTGFYDDPGVRMMIDIDMLVPRERALDCLSILQNNTYETLHLLQHANLCHHFPAMIKKNEVASVELHQDIVVGDYLHLLTTKEVWKDSIPWRVGGYAFRIPKPKHMVLLHLIHSQLSDIRYAFLEIKLSQCYDLLLMKKKYQKQIAWDRLIQSKKQPYNRAFAFFLTISDQLFMESKCKSMGIQSIGVQISRFLFWFQFKYKQLKFPIKSIHYHAVLVMDLFNNPNRRKSVSKKIFHLKSHKTHIEFLLTLRQTRN